IASGSSTYGSALNPGAVTFDNAVSGDDVSSTAGVDTSTLSTSGNPVAGTYTQTAGAISGDDAGNYTFAGFTTATENYTINPLAITGNITAGNETYNTTTAATITGRSLTGAIDGDLVSYTGGTAVFDNPNAATGKTVTATGLSLTGADAGNYTVNTTATTTATIAPAALTVTANDDSKTYNGLAYSGGNGVTYSGFVDGQTESVLGGTLAYGGTSQGAVNVGSYTIIPSGLTSGNYTINYIDGTLSIAARHSFQPALYMYRLLDTENNEDANLLNNMTLAGLSGDGLFNPHDRHWTIEGNIFCLPGQED
ncbi:MAG: YDG domain-containing protein, partial [Deltaproteobacteria bacterium]|nr:YDG domain-containing protein [Deltaproteobacteria bacterium]